ncbi:hypothetical protein Y032_0405g866 [Ancylostoma ceylanicum]|uniref:Uncharacterized protein n=1 Tax=Ancylostoma ceylanicum TaxID=53326 RepID=A0A016X2W2_9BILA|nr:hypothetical protein Y032_0405g866 [Ancylostoma ceylanicum]
MHENSKATHSTISACLGVIPHFRTVPSHEQESTLTLEISNRTTRITKTAGRRAASAALRLASGFDLAGSGARRVAK